MRAGSRRGAAAVALRDEAATADHAVEETRPELRCRHCKYTTTFKSAMAVHARVHPGAGAGTRGAWAHGSRVSPTLLPTFHLPLPSPPSTTGSLRSRPHSGFSPSTPGGVNDPAIPRGGSERSHTAGLIRQPHTPPLSASRPDGDGGLDSRAREGVKGERQSRRVRVAPRRHDCPHCTSCFESQESLDAHIKTHQLQPTVRCPKCPFVSHARGISHHLWNLHRIEAYSCTECDFRTSRKITLDAHMKSHYYVCDICGFAASKITHLEHMRSHFKAAAVASGGKSVAKHPRPSDRNKSAMPTFACEHCRYTTTDHKELVRHRETSHDEDPKTDREEDEEIEEFDADDMDEVPITVTPTPTSNRTPTGASTRTESGDTLRDAQPRMETVLHALKGENGLCDTIEISPTRPRQADLDLGVPSEVGEAQVEPWPHPPRPSHKKKPSNEPAKEATRKSTRSRKPRGAAVLEATARAPTTKSKVQRDKKAIATTVEAVVEEEREGSDGSGSEDESEEETSCALQPMWFDIP